MKRRILIMGAAGRDFHNFNTVFRDDPKVRVAAFTAAQIPFIEGRTYPPVLAGSLYPEGIPIYPESRLAELISTEDIDEVVFSYSDVPFDYVMTRASMVSALGADFVLLGPEKTMLASKKPVISVCAVRTGCGKSGVTRFIAKVVREAGLNPVAIRHPMPYGDLAAARVQRFSDLDSIKKAGCTIEEREEYEPLVEAGFVVYSGVDYGEIFARAEAEGDVVIWDGGNNDLPFVRPDLEIVLTDALRPGHETGWWPGEVNVRRADVVVVNKAGAGAVEDVAAIIRCVKTLNPAAEVIKTDSVLDAGPGAEEKLRGRKVLVIEDGPTLTHGGMATGAGHSAAVEHGAEPVDVRSFATGTIRDTLVKYPQAKNVLPAMGYSTEQMADLAETIRKAPVDVVVVATPVDLSRLVRIDKPVVRVSYEVRDVEDHGLAERIRGFIKVKL